MVEIQFTPKVLLVSATQNSGILRLMSHQIYGVKPSENLVEKLIQRRHTSPLEFIDTIWYIECSRVVSHELVRHRIASYWQESQRFVKPEPIFIVPRSLVKKLGFDKLKQLFETLWKEYDELTYGCKKFGEDFKQFARYILPQCIKTRIFAKFNLRELIEVVLPLRMCRRALPEFRYITIKMYLSLKQLYPEIVKYTGARCTVLGYCPELNIKNHELMRKCRVEGYKEAIYEHGTDEEISKIDEIISELP